MADTPKNKTSKNLWDEWLEEISSLQQQSHDRIVPIIAKFNQMISDSGPVSSIQSLNQMVTELHEKCTGKSPLEKLKILNNYFFYQKGFVLDQQEPTQGRKQASSMSKILLYQYLAKALEVPLNVLGTPYKALLKWSRGDKTEYIDLENGGKFLTPNDLLKCANEKKENLEGRDSQQLLKTYLTGLSEDLESEKDLEKLHTVLNALLLIEPNNFQTLSRRALVRRNMGLNKEALSDLKRYFAFNDKTKAPAEIKMAYYELQAFGQSSDGTHEVLH